MTDEIQCRHGDHKKGRRRVSDVRGFLIQLRAFVSRLQVSATLDTDVQLIKDLDAHSRLAYRAHYSLAYARTRFPRCPRKTFVTIPVFLETGSARLRVVVPAVLAPVSCCCCYRFGGVVILISQSPVRNTKSRESRRRRADPPAALRRWLRSVGSPKARAVPHRAFGGTVEGAVRIDCPKTAAPRSSLSGVILCQSLAIT